MEKIEAKDGSPEDTPPIILKDALNRAMGDTQLIQILLDEFKSSVWNHFKNIKDALHRGDKINLEQEAHQLKGAAGSLSIVGVAAKSYDLERMGKGDLEINAGATADLENEIQRFLDYIDQIDWERI